MLVDQQQVPVGAIFQHYKGKRYKILAIARHEESLESYVVYEGQYVCETFGPNPVWMRPLKAFLETITQADGTAISRFQKV